ncbi:UPF0280 family protein [Kumtagia ephedrae]|uniref:Uncharacterized protein n=1 Tax=Kumtagia ephedrae TaxID=2116701 RepID=A0A2P7S297_9HYPH|nr:UPF0280 family protein [Mesorhizobium ephedrae]PSJ56582.1 hypothetical protein C7I84_20390 [Mesorhizobium ephedrae]
MHEPRASWLPDGRRLHLNHGPIDLIVEAFGTAEEVHAAYAQAAARFRSVLAELVAELPELRRVARLGAPRAFIASTARRMEAAVEPLAEEFITPMAAVAGSVADEMLAAMLAGRTLERAYVNNGGDIALHLAPGQEISLAIAGTGHGFDDRITIRAAEPVRGIATSGWRGRSFSLGIADAVTVLARTGAEADAAATVIANAVDLPKHPAVSRRPAVELAPDSDLGARPVTVGVGALTAAEIDEALARGLAVAEALRLSGLIDAAALFLAAEARVCGALALPAGAKPAASPPALREDRASDVERILPRGLAAAFPNQRPRQSKDCTHA